MQIKPKNDCKVNTGRCFVTVEILGFFVWFLLDFDPYHPCLIFTETQTIEKLRY